MWKILPSSEVANEFAKECLNTNKLFFILPLDKERETFLFYETKKDLVEGIFAWRKLQNPNLPDLTNLQVQQAIEVLSKPYNEQYCILEALAQGKKVYLEKETKQILLLFLPSYFEVIK